MVSGIGFIGLGVMGEPICRNLARKSGRVVIGFDRTDASLQRLADDGVARADTLADLARQCDVIFMALPSGQHVEAVCAGPDGLLDRVGAHHTIVDLGTSPVDATRQLAKRFADKGAVYADAPIARTRQAAEDGTLSVMVGGDDATFARLKPLIATFATEITHCGAVGAGQVVKILNNMLVFQHCAALAEAIAIGRRHGVPAEVLLPTMAKGSGDSFVLRNHGMKSMLPKTFPLRAFSTRYAIKDLSYALEMAEASSLDMKAAQLTMERLKAAEAAGFGDEYHPVVLNVIDPE